MESGNLRGQLPQPKPINNAALAIVLHICGVPFTTHEGIIFPGFNFYSDALLKEKGYEGKPRTASIQGLFRRGIPGQLVYQFERVQGSTLIEEICDGWDKQAEAIKKAEEHPAESRERPYAATETMSKGLPAPEVIAAICCQYAKGRKDFMGSPGTTPIWRRRAENGRLFMPAMKAIEGPSRTERDGERVVIYGSLNLKEVKV